MVPDTDAIAFHIFKTSKPICTISDIRVNLVNVEIFVTMYGVSRIKELIRGADCLLAICLCPNGCTVLSGVVVVVGVCNRSQMRTSKSTCLVFGVSIGFEPA